ncbi:MAG: thrombospondin type 3 repeat-containing protein [Patescibacteria group bacterium]
MCSSKSIKFRFAFFARSVAVLLIGIFIFGGKSAAVFADWEEDVEVSAAVRISAPLDLSVETYIFEADLKWQASPHAVSGIVQKYRIYYKPSVEAEYPSCPPSAEDEAASKGCVEVLSLDQNPDRIYDKTISNLQIIEYDFLVRAVANAEVEIFDANIHESRVDCASCERAIIPISTRYRNYHFEIVDPELPEIEEIEETVEEAEEAEELAPPQTIQVEKIQTNFFPEESEVSKEIIFTIDVPDTSDAESSGLQTTFVSLDISDLKTVENEESEPVDDRLIEIGYTDQHDLWRSFRNVKINGSEAILEVAVGEKITAAARLIDAAILEDVAIIRAETNEKFTTEKPVLVNRGGEISLAVNLVSKSFLGGGIRMSVEISAKTNVADNSGNSYERVIYAPQAVNSPPQSSSGSFAVAEAVSVGSSSTSLYFSQPVLLELSVTENIRNPGVVYFDEEIEEWLVAQDVATGEFGGSLSVDRETISIYVDHMTLFSVVDFAKEIVDSMHAADSNSSITRISLGPDFEKRRGFASEEWFSSADIGNDDRVSFMWSGSGEKFYYELDGNPEPDSITTAAASTAEFFLDDVAISEGTSYFHLQAEDAEGVRSEEKVFTLNYDKTAPRLESVVAEISKNGSSPSGRETANFTLQFSEPVVSFDILTVYFGSAAAVEIPAFNSFTDQIKGSFEISAPIDLDFESVTVVGMLADRAGLVVINPTPVAQQIDSGRIGRAELIVRRVQLVEGKYFTKGDQVTIIPRAVGATKMRLAANVLLADSQPLPVGEWLPYASQEFEIALTDEFGARSIVMEFADEEGNVRRAGTIVTRLAAESEERQAAESVWRKMLSLVREKIIKTISSLVAWGLSPDYEQLLAEDAAFNPVILAAANTERPSTEEIDELNSALAAAKEIRAFAMEEIISFRKLKKTLRQFENKNYSLDDFLTVGEINLLLARLGQQEGNEIISFLDPNTIAIQKKSNGRILVGERSLGLRDSDGDGLSDRLELQFGTNPYLADSDLDGLSDGEEILDFDTDPLEADRQLRTRFTNLREGMLLADPLPILRGTARAGETVNVVAFSASGKNIELGKTTADANSKWLLRPETILPAGRYELRMKSAGELLDTVTVEINLDFILLPPKLHFGETVIFDNLRPTFYGNTFYGNTIVANFQSDLVSTSIVVDNPAGDFVIRPPQDLPAGEHVLTVFTKMSDGFRSPTRTVRFTIEPKKIDVNFSLLRNAAVAVLFIFGVSALFWFRKSRWVAS